MSAGGREASTPPQLPGFDYVRVLGVGGFADVFLYRQHLPSRLVAVKVLLAAGMNDEVRARFTDEANLMAQLSHHPSIVTVHHASVAADGRPYLVMEYCSQPSLAQRYRAERMGVAEVLRIGVRLAAAVETAHRAGILHRDIKPANVLTTDFGWPALTDFGIAATVGGRADGARAAVGLSIPWAPPEMLAEPPRADERSDVYSLAATLYSLIAGRSPYEVPGGANSAADLIARIERGPAPALRRADVPASLAGVLRRGMAPSPGERYASAAALGRALQQVEAELALPVTTLDLPGEPGACGPARGGAADEETRARPVVVAPGAPVAPLTGPPAGGAAPPAPPRPLVVGPDDDATRPRPPVEVRPSAPAPSGPVSSRTRGVAGTVAAAAVVVAAVAGLVVAWLHGASPQPAPRDSMVADVATPAAAVPAVTDLAGARTGDVVTFTWTEPDPQAGDRFGWGVVTATGEEPLALVDEPAVTVPAPEGEVCVQVLLVRADGRVSPAVRECAG